jgi:catechol 2,3-dioxygenase-like lactoylglutathione lyase family enzyme
MIPMLPCRDIDEMAAFWTPLGLEVTYRQVRPNPYLALGRNAIDLHYFGMEGVDPQQSYSTCGIVVMDTEPLHELFAEGFRTLYGRVPVEGIPRMTRPRRRANNAGLSGFSVIDPAGNWIRVSRRPTGAEQPRSIDGRTEWVSAGGGPLVRAVENAVVLADSHGDIAQALRALTGVLKRQGDAPVSDRAAAWAFLAELRFRGGDLAGAADAANEVKSFADTPNLPVQDRKAVAAALREVDELPLGPGNRGSTRTP